MLVAYAYFLIQTICNLENKGFLVDNKNPIRIPYSCHGHVSFRKPPKMLHFYLFGFFKTVKGMVVDIMQVCVWWIIHITYIEKLKVVDSVCLYLLPFLFT